MNSVHVYVDGQRLDLFQDETIQYQAIVSNLTELDSIFTDFSQSFTIPASPTNDTIFGYYYREDISAGGFDGRISHPSLLELNGLPWKQGVVKIESVEIKNNMPYSYTIGFYAGVVNMVDLFAEDFLYDLDLSAYDHAYTDGAIATRAFSNSTGTDLFYPLMSPKERWFYNSRTSVTDPANIAFHSGTANHGIAYYELKPALRCIKILEAIETKYGIDFQGPFLSDTRFTPLYMWLHRKEGWMYESQISAMTYEIVPFDAGSGTFDPITDKHTATADDYFQFDINVSVLVGGDANFAVYINGAYRDSVVAITTGIVTITNVWMNAGDVMDLRVKSNDGTTPLTYRVANMDITSIGYGVLVGTAQQVFSRTIASDVRVSELMPEMKVRDFVQGLFRMFNLICIPLDNTTFYLENKEDWHDSGTEKDITAYVDVDSVTKMPVPLYEEINYKYAKSDQILNNEYNATNAQEWGQLRSDFAIDTKQDFTLELPFEMPFFERLTDQNTTGSGLGLTSVYIYNSIKRNQNADGTFQPYVGKPVLIYGKWSHSMAGFPVGFVSASGSTVTGYSTCWWAGEASTDVSAATAKALNFGGDINPYFLSSIGDSLYDQHFREYIEDLYNSKKRLVTLTAYYPTIEILKFELNDILIWNGFKYRIVDAQFDLKIGKAILNLVNIVGEAVQEVPTPIEAP